MASPLTSWASAAVSANHPPASASSAESADSAGSAGMGSSGLFGSLAGGVGRGNRASVHAGAGAGAGVGAIYAAATAPLAGPHNQALAQAGSGPNGPNSPNGGSSSNSSSTARMAGVARRRTGTLADDSGSLDSGSPIDANNNNSDNDSFDDDDDHNSDDADNAGSEDRSPLPATSVPPELESLQRSAATVKRHTFSAVSSGGMSGATGLSGAINAISAGAAYAIPAATASASGPAGNTMSSIVYGVSVGSSISASGSHMARFAHANAHANTHANAIAGNLDSSAPPHSSSSSAAGLLATLATAPRAAISCVSLSPDASLVYAGTADGSIHEWPSTPSSGGRSRGGKHDQRQQAQQAQQTQQKHRVLAGHAKAVTSIQSAGLVLFSASEDGSLIIWDVPAASPLRKIRAHQPNAATAICFTGGLLYSGGSDTIVSAWNPKNGRRQWVLTGHSGPVLALTASPNTIPHRLFSASADKTIRIWDTENGRVLRVLEGHQDWVHSIALHGPRLYSGARDGEIKLWGALDGDCISSFVGHDSRAVRSLTIAGDRLVSAGEDCSIVVWDLDAHMPMKTVRAHKAAVTAIAASVDGTVIASGSADEFVSVWSFADMVVTDDNRSIISRSDLSLPTPPMSPYTLDMQAGTAATAGSGANMRTASRPRSIITSSVHPHRPPSEHPHPHSQVNPSSQSRVAQSEAAYAAHAATAAAAAHAAQLHQTDQVIQTLREQLARSQEQITKHDRVRLKLKGDLTSARTELFEKKEVIKELQDQLATAHNEHNSTKEELLDSQAALEAVRVELKLVRDAYDRALGWIIRQAHRQFVSSEIELHSVDRFLNHAYSSFASDARDDRHAPPAKRTWEFDSDYDSDTDIAATSTAWWRSDGQGHVPTWTKEAMLRAYFCSPNAASPTTSREGQSPLWSGIGDRRTLSYLAPSNQSLRFSSGLGMYSSTLGGNSSVSSFGSITGATMAATALPSSNLSPGRDTVNRMFVHPDRPAAGNSRAAVHTTPITLDLASGAERDKEAELSDATSRSSVAAVRLAAARGATAAGVNMGSISSISSIPDTIDDSLSSVQVKRASVNVNMLGAASGAATTGSRPAPWHRPAQNMPGVSEASAQQPTAVWQQQQQQDDDDDDDFEPSSVERSKAVLSRKPPAAALSKVGSTTPATGASATAKRTSVMVKTNEVYRFDESPRTPSADLKKIEDQDEDDSDFDDDYDGDDNDDEDDVDSQLDDYDGDSTSEGGTDMPMAVAESRANGPQARWNVDDATAAARTASVPRRQPGAEDSSSTSTEWRKDPQAVKALEDFLTADGNSEIEYHGKARLAVSRGSTVSAKTGVTTATATTATTAKVSVSAATRASRRHTTMMDGSHVVPAGSRDTKPPTGRTASTTHRFSTLSTSGMAANRPDATANNGLLSPGAASSSSGGGGERSSTIERMASSFENALETAIESPWSLVPGWLKSTRPAAPSAAVNTQPLTPQQLQQQTLSPD